MALTVDKQSFDIIVTNNYSKLKKVAFNICVRINYKKQLDLLNDVLLQVYEKKHYEKLMYEDDCIKYIMKFMQQYYQWCKNNKHNFRKDNHLFSFEPQYEDIIHKEPYYDSDEIIINAETISKNPVENKMYISLFKDAYYNNKSIEEIILLKNIKELLNNHLSTFELDYYKMRYENELNVKEIAKILNISYYKMRQTNTQINLKIKNICLNYLYYHSS